MKMKILVWIMAAIIVLAVAGYWLYSRPVSPNVAVGPVSAGGSVQVAEPSLTPSSNQNIDNPATSKSSQAKQPEQAIITYTDSGFSPNPLNVKVGTTVVFKNESSNDFWPASNNHPTHTFYPGSDIAKCGTPEKNKIFDACRSIPSGGSWQFKFDIPGGWKYHNHLIPGDVGKIIVE